MPRICVAGGCSNTKTDDISLHTFPLKDSKRLTLWNRFMRVRRADWKGPSNHSVLCSAHFLPSDFKRSLQHEWGFTKNTVLNSDAVPSVQTPRKDETSCGTDEPVSKKKRTSLAAVKLSGHRRWTESQQTVTASTSKQIDVPVQPEEPVDTESNIGRATEVPATCIGECACTCGLAKPKPAHTMPRATQCYPRKNMRNKGITVKIKSSSVGIQCNLGPKVDPPVILPSPAAKSVRLTSTPVKTETLATSSPPTSPLSNVDDQVPSHDDPDYKPSNTSMQEFEAEREQTAELTNTSIYHKTPNEEEKFIVFRSSLEELFQSCPLCADDTCSTVFSSDFPKQKNGTYISVEQTCLCGYERTWESQPKIGRMAAGNILVSAALLYSGSQYSKVRRFFDFLNIPFNSKTTFQEHQKKYLIPVVINEWKNQQDALFHQLREMDGPANLGADGRADSPGHSAKYGSYTNMELRLGKVIDIQLVQSNEVKNSYWMEPEGLKRSIQRLEEEGIQTGAIVTDRHRSIAKWIRLNMKDTKHYYDIWHIAKGLGKKLDKMALQKDCEVIREWKKSIINHLYWCAASTPDGDGAVMLAKWKSLSNHVINKHDNHGDPLFAECQHGSLPEERKKKWIKPGTKASVQLDKLLTDTMLLKDVQQLSPIQQTASVEGFHSTIIHFAPKHTGFHYLAMNCRLILAALHFNENSNRARKYTKSGEKVLTVYFSKAKKGEPSVRWEKTDPTYSYGHNLIANLVRDLKEKKDGMSESVQSINVPPFLTAATQDVDRSAAREQFGSYMRFADSSS